MWHKSFLIDLSAAGVSGIQFTPIDSGYVINNCHWIDSPLSFYSMLSKANEQQMTIVACSVRQMVWKLIVSNFTGYSFMVYNLTIHNYLDYPRHLKFKCHIES